MVEKVTHGKTGMKKAYRMQEEGLSAWEEYRSVVRKTKIHLELNLKKEVKDNKKRFFNYINSKKDYVGLLPNEVGILVMEALGRRAKRRIQETTGHST